MYPEFELKKAINQDTMSKTPLIRSISSPRLSSYLKFFGCENENDCLHYYFWNQELSSELYVLLGNIEVCLRNRIHDALSIEASFKVDPDNVQDNFAWYQHIDFYEKDSETGSTRRDRSGRPILNETGKGFKKLKGKQPQVIVSKLEFGKWPYVLQSKWYQDSSSIDWVKVFPAIFPYFQNMSYKSHDLIIERIKTACRWRNRLAHLEPVWKFGAVIENGTGRILVPEPRNQKEVIKRLNKEIRLCVQLLSWLCEDTERHYKETASYRRLLQLASHEGISDFSY